MSSVSLKNEQYDQGWEFAHALIAQIKWATVSDSLWLLKTNEWPWAICSGRSEEMSNPEGIAQIAQDKWATMREKMSKWAVRSKKFGQKNIKLLKVSKAFDK